MKLLSKRKKDSNRKRFVLARSQVFGPLLTMLGSTVLATSSFVLWSFTDVWPMSTSLGWCTWRKPFSPWSENQRVYSQLYIFPCNLYLLCRINILNSGSWKILGFLPMIWKSKGIFCYIIYLNQVELIQISTCTYVCYVFDKQ